MLQFAVSLAFDGKSIYTGPYSLGTRYVSKEILKKLARYPFSTSSRIVEHLIKSGLSGQWIGDTRATAEKILLHAAKVQKLAPNLPDVVSSLLMDGGAYFDRQSFGDWCADFGYSDDSIKARDTYETCWRTGRAIADHIKPTEIETLREWASQY